MALTEKQKSHSKVGVKLVKERWSYTSGFTGGSDHGWHGIIYSEQDSLAIYYRTRDRMVGSDGSWAPLDAEDHNYDEDLLQLFGFGKAKFYPSIEEQADNLKQTLLEIIEPHNPEGHRFSQRSIIDNVEIPRESYRKIARISGKRVRSNKDVKFLEGFLFGELNLLGASHVKRRHW